MRCIFTLFVLIIVPSGVLVEKFFNDSNEKIIQIARIHGYPIETHHVQTEDGYLLTIYRIPHGRNTNETGESPVLLNHGLLGSAELFISLGPPNALAFLLADSGYDVWLMNARGTWHSKKHKTLKPNQKEFWNFSWHEIGVYDLPACIDLILQTANKSSISFIGHSQGGTTLAVMGSERPEYNSKIKLAIGLSPGIFYKNFKTPLLRFLAMNYKIFEVVTDVSKIYELPPFLFSDANIRAVLETYCVKTTAFKNLCGIILNFVYALVGGSYISDEEILQYIYLLSPSSTAINQLFHYAQLIVTKNFQQYDHGSEQNIRKYGTASPPLYNLKNLTFPFALFIAPADKLVTPEDSLLLAGILSNVVGVYEVPSKSFGHFDYIYKKSAKKLVYDDLLKLLKAYTSN